MSPPTTTSPPELNVVQRWFQAVITHPGGVAVGVASADAQNCFAHPVQEIAALITPSSKLDAESRLAIYADAYFARLIECLGDVFPVLKRTLGEEVFTDFAFDYLQTHPSRRYTLHVLGVQFPDFLTANRPSRGPENAPDWADFIIELARFEWVIYEVFDGPGTEELPPFDATPLSTFSSEELDSFRLKIAPCFRLFRGDFPVSDFFTRARQSKPEEGLEAPQPETTFTAISRRDYVVRRHPLGPAEHSALKVLAEGGTISEAIRQALVIEPVEPDQITAWFSRWARDGFFV